MRYMIHAVDHPDSLALRLATRAGHLDYIASFDLLVAGPLLDREGNPCGSCLIVELPDIAAAEAFAAGDLTRWPGCSRPWRCTSSGPSPGRPHQTRVRGR